MDQASTCVDLARLSISIFLCCSDTMASDGPDPLSALSGAMLPDAKQLKRMSLLISGVMQQNPFQKSFYNYDPQSRILSATIIRRYLILTRPMIGTSRSFRLAELKIRWVKSLQARPKIIHHLKDSRVKMRNPLFTINVVLQSTKWYSKTYFSSLISASTKAGW